jgi:hypothetical protein
MCLKDDYLLKEQFLEILSYFVFDGTGKGYSKCKSNAIMTYQNDKLIFKDAIIYKIKNCSLNIFMIK